MMEYILQIHVCICFSILLISYYIDRGNSNSHLREENVSIKKNEEKDCFFFLMASRAGPRWHAAELVHIC